MTCHRPPCSWTELVHTMGTVVSIDVRAAVRPPGLDAAVTAVARRLRHIDELFSTWRADSWVSRLGSGGTTRVDCPGEVREVLALADRMAVLTDGYFSPFWQHRAAGPVGPDPTGLVKGWAAHQASDVLLDHGLGDHVVNAAGDLLVSGRPAVGRAGDSTWRVGISDPHDTKTLAGVVSLGSGPSRWAVATSGVAELGHHVVDPHTGSFPRTVASATAVARVHGSGTGALVDACATALVAAGHRSDALLGGLTGHGVRGLVIDASGAVTDPHRLFADSVAPD